MKNYPTSETGSVHTALENFIMFNELGTQWTMEISSNVQSAPMAIEKIKILCAVFELPAKQQRQFSLFTK